MAEITYNLTADESRRLVVDYIGERQEHMFECDYSLPPWVDGRNLDSDHKNVRATSSSVIVEDT